MRKPLDAWTRVGIVLAFSGISTAIAGWTFPGPLLFWITWTCISIAAIMFLISLLLWCISIFSWWQWVAGAFGTTLFVFGLTTAIMWTAPDPGSQADPLNQRMDGTKPQEDGAGKRETGRILKVDLPGYTSTLLLYWDKHDVSPRENIFEDANTEGTTVAFSSAEHDSFVFSVTDSHGKHYSLNIPSGPSGIPVDKSVYVAYEAGTTKTSSFLRALVDGKEVSSRDFDSPIDFGN
jgi:hypothetical protein